MVTLKSSLIGCCVVGIICLTAVGAEIKLKPVRATGSYSIVGNTIIVDSAGQWVFLEATISGWDPDLDGTPKLRTWQAEIDSSGYSSGLAGVLTPASTTCAVNGDCRVPFGGVCSVAGATCVADTDCPYYQYEEVCRGAPCDYPTGVGGHCSPGFQFTGRTDRVLLDQLPAVDVATLDFRYGATTSPSGQPMTDPGTPGYGGTLVLEVPVGARGTFTVEFTGGTSNFLRDQDDVLIEPLTLTPALIAVRCNTGNDCDDGDPCTNNVCTGGLCSNPHSTAPCNDGNPCNVGEACSSGVCTGGGPVDCSGAGGDCNTASCDPAGTEGNCDALTPANEGQPCDDGPYCMVDGFCIDGDCGGGVDRDCADAIDCTDDWCDEAGNRCAHDPNHTLCPNDGLWCNGSEYCHVILGCVHSGSPCGGPCDEESDRCLCEAPTVAGAGGRYLWIQPEPSDSGPQALLVTPSCPGGNPKYVGAPVLHPTGGIEGTAANFAKLVDDPSQAVFLTPAEWREFAEGPQLYVYGVDIVPATVYRVQGDCGSPGAPGLSDSSYATTPKWGDTVGRYFGGNWLPPDGIVDYTDIVAVIQGFVGHGGVPPLFGVDLVGSVGSECVPDRNIDFLDISSAIDGFRGLLYRQSFPNCPLPCP